MVIVFSRGFAPSLSSGFQCRRCHGTMRKNWQLGALGVIMVWYCVARYGVVSPGVAQPVWCGVVYHVVVTV